MAHTEVSELKPLLGMPLRPGEFWYLINSRWFKQWKKYVGFDSWDRYNVGEPKLFPGPIDNSGLFANSETQILKEYLIDEVDYVLVPTEAWNKLVNWYGCVEGQKPIVRKVVEYGLFLKYCKVEVYPLELKLCQNSDPNNLISCYFSKADTIDTIGKEMRKLFNIPDWKEIKLWLRYTSIYEQLSKLDSTIQDAGLYQRQVVVIEVKNEDGTWPRQSPVTKFGSAIIRSLATSSKMTANPCSTTVVSSDITNDDCNNSYGLNSSHRIGVSDQIPRAGLIGIDVLEHVQSAFVGTRAQTHQAEQNGENNKVTNQMSVGELERETQQSEMVEEANLADSLKGPAVDFSLEQRQDNSMKGCFDLMETNTQPLNPEHPENFILEEKMIQACEELRVPVENSRLEKYFKLKEDEEKLAQLEKVQNEAIAKELKEAKILQPSVIGELQNEISPLKGLLEMKEKGLEERRNESDTFVFKLQKKSAELDVITTVENIKEKNICNLKMQLSGASESKEDCLQHLTSMEAELGKEILNNEQLCLDGNKVSLDMEKEWNKIADEFRTLQEAEKQIENCVKQKPYLEVKNANERPDSVVAKDTWEKQLQPVNIVLQRIREAEKMKGASKWRLGNPEVNYLRHIVGRGVIDPLQRKIDTIDLWPRQTNNRKVRSFFGLVVYHRRVSPHLSTIATPLTELTKTKHPYVIQWSPEYQAAFEGTLMNCTRSGVRELNPTFQEPKGKWHQVTVNWTLDLCARGSDSPWRSIVQPLQQEAKDIDYMDHG